MIRIIGELAALFNRMDENYNVLKCIVIERKGAVPKAMQCNMA
jgi:hypothetical protein